jgi:NAD+ synthase (glutamine-hydrolysing)
LTTIRISIAQINPTVGDLWGNAELMSQKLTESQNEGADLCIFPELAVSGYPPEDLAFNRDFVIKTEEAAKAISANTKRTVGVFGSLRLASDPEAGKIAHNSLVIAADGEVMGFYDKIKLPNYSVFDEIRTFIPGNAEQHNIYIIAGIRFAVLICEDAWYPQGPFFQAFKQGSECAIVINASPFYKSRIRERIVEMKQRVIESPIPLIYANIVGGQDELVFDGGSFVLDEKSELIAKASQFKEELLTFDLEVPEIEIPLPAANLIAVSGRPRPQQNSLLPQLTADLNENNEIYEALVLGTRDYVNKNKFPGALIGLSGGIDSSLVACIAADALGPDKVTGIAMPSAISSIGSVKDARKLAKNLSIEFIEIPIEDVLKVFKYIIEKNFGRSLSGLSLENIQPRIRAVILMALSNMTSKIVLTTGNKSETASGYSTIYGDTAGGFGVIKDVFKQQVYELARYKNKTAGFDVIPESILIKPPSAELKPDQIDEDTLGDYETLDAILKLFIEENKTLEEIIERGFEKTRVKEIVARVERNEYKRRQSPPGIRISKLSFGRDRRMPITNAFFSKEFNV